MKWRKFSYEGHEYDLSHLHPFVWHFDAPKKHKYPARKYRFNVTFSMHCFTREPLRTEKVDPALLYHGPKEIRTFCFERYDLSTQLPSIIQRLGDKSCWHTHHGNFFTVELQDPEGQKNEYEVYFDVFRSGRGWMTLIIQSAYIRDERYETAQPRKRSVGFGVIARARQENKELRPPP
ncbi:MAG: heat-shock protein [Thiothrix sp.]|jgi:hypothetical protein|nr:MAG: heat-shock protein [Thiothrix sp.]